MKFLRVAGVHYSYAKTFPYETNPAMKDLPYESQLREFFSFHFHYSDSLTHHLNRMGYEASEILYDVELLQKKWADENGVQYSQENWQSEILVGQINRYKPDVLYLHNSGALPDSVLRRRKELFPFLRCLIVFRGYPEVNRDLLKLFGHADLLLVGSPVLEKLCRKNKLHPYLFHHYFDDRILKHMDLSPVTGAVRPFTFLGTSGFGYGWNHQPRYQFLMELLRSTEIECWLEEGVNFTSQRWKDLIKRSVETVLASCPQSILCAMKEAFSFPSSVQKMAFNSLARKIALQAGCRAFPNIPLSALFREKCHGPVFGLPMFQRLALSKVSFNKHTFAASGTVDNIRLFEGTGVGTCLLTDAGSNLSQLFEVGQEVVDYSSIDECKEKLRYLLLNDAVRKEIAIRGQKRTLKDHTALQRAGRLDMLVKEKIRAN